MSLLSSNLLNAAARLTGMQMISLCRILKTQTNDAGVIAPVYDEPKVIHAQVQAVQRTMYEALGLDLQRDYVTVYTSTILTDVGAGDFPDRLIFNNRFFDVESNTDWQNQNGWNGSICVDVGPAV